MKKYIILLVVFLLLGVFFYQCFNQRPILKIFVTYHKPHELSYEMIKNKNFIVPIQVGRAVETEPFSGGQLGADDIKWLHNRMIGDDTGDNISLKNREFDVLTAYYWVWKNYDKIGNPEYIGFFSHHKWLTLDDIDVSVLYQKRNIDDIIKYDRIVDILRRHQIICTVKAIAFEGGDKPIPLYLAFSMSHNLDDLNAMLRVIDQTYPQLSGVAREVLSDDKKVYAAWNFWIMKKELAFDYFTKLFQIMNALEQQIGADVKRRDYYQRRVFGYLAERFFAIWLEYQKRMAGITPYQAFDFSFD